MQLQIFIHTNMTVGKRLKAFQEWLHLIIGHFIKAFYQMTAFE